ncbi:DNA-directed RNA polymerase II core subunit, partial [Ascosphaera pollenicola]
MASDQSISQFTEICGCSTRIAKQYLQLADDNIEQATMLFFENGGVDMNPTESTATATAPASASRADTSASATRAGRGATGRRGAYREDSSGVVDLASDEDEDDVFEVDNPHYESDEAMARRLQEEMYGAGRSGAGAGAGDADDVRAPMARTTETLVGPDYGGMGMGTGFMPGGLGRGRR